MFRTISLLPIVVAFSLASCGKAATAKPAYNPHGLEILIPTLATARALQPLEAVVATRAPLGRIAQLTAGGLPEGAALSDRGDGTALFSWVPRADQAGSHTVTLQAAAGSLTAESKWQIDVHAGAATEGTGGKTPLATDLAPVWHAPLEIWAFTGMTAAVTVVAEDPEKKTILYSLLAAPAGVTFSSSLHRLYVSLLLPGAYRVDLRASDGIHEALHTLWIHAQAPGNYAPEISLSSTAVTLPGGKPWQMPIAVRDANGDALTLWAEGPDGLQWTPGALAWTPPYHGAGDVWVTLHAADGMTVTTVTLRLQVTDAPNSAPVIAAFAVPALFQGGLVQFSAPATDGEGDPFTYSVSVTSTTYGAFAPASIDLHGNVSWRVPAGMLFAFFYFEVSATDTYGAKGFRKESQVVIVNTAPVISAGSVPQATRNQPWAFNLVATDTDPVYLQVITGPAGMSPVSSGSPLNLTWTPTGVSGSVPLGVAAVDSHGARAYWSGTIEIGNRPPQFQAWFPASRACLGKPMPFAISNPTDPDGDPLTYTGDHDDIQFSSPATGGVVAFTDRGRDPLAGISIRANDGFGGAADAWWPLQIFGWRDQPQRVNRLSLGQGWKTDLHARAITDVPGAGAGFVTLWREYQYTGAGITPYDIFVQRLDRDGCPMWNSGAPVSVDNLSNSKIARGISVAASGVLTAYSVTGSVATGSCPVGQNGMLVSAVGIDSGLPKSNLCLYSTSLTFVYQGHLTGRSDSNIHLLTFGVNSTNSLYGRFVKLGADGAISATVPNVALACNTTPNPITGAGCPFTIDNNNFNQNQHATDVNTGDKFIIAWARVTGGAGMVATYHENAGAVAGLYGARSFDAGPIANPRAAMFNDNNAVVAFTKNSDFLARGVNALGALGTNEYLIDNNAPGAVGADSALLKADSADAVWVAWIRNSAEVRATRLDVAAATQIITQGWNGGAPVTVAVSASQLRNVHLARTGDALAVLWEEQDAFNPSQVHPRVRFLRPSDGVPLGDARTVSTLPGTSNASYSWVGAAGGAALIWLDGTNDPTHYDVSAAWINSAGGRVP